MVGLRTYFNDMISDKEFEEKKKQILAKDDVKIQDKEQLRYYEHFRKLFENPQRSSLTTAEYNAPTARVHVKTKIQFCKYAKLTQSTTPSLLILVPNSPTFS